MRKSDLKLNKIILLRRKQRNLSRASFSETCHPNTLNLFESGTSVISANHFIKILLTIGCIDFDINDALLTTQLPEYVEYVKLIDRFESSKNGIKLPELELSKHLLTSFQTFIKSPDFDKLEPVLQLDTIAKLIQLRMQTITSDEESEKVLTDACSTFMESYDPKHKMFTKPQIELLTVICTLDKNNNKKFNRITSKLFTLLTEEPRLKEYHKKFILAYSQMHFRSVLHKRDMQKLKNE